MLEVPDNILTVLDAYLAEQVDGDGKPLFSSAADFVFKTFLGNNLVPLLKSKYTTETIRQAQAAAQAAAEAARQQTEAEITSLVSGLKVTLL